MLPSCAHLTVFGEESTNYDEAKRFCYDAGGYSSEQGYGKGCVVYSIGSNNQWDFEQHMHDHTVCQHIETFDCTVMAEVSADIRDRTHFHHICLGGQSTQRAVKHGNVDMNVVYLTLADINKKVLKRSRGPDFLKIDVEV
jgi:hypothetical protein